MLMSDTCTQEHTLTLTRTRARTPARARTHAHWSTLRSSKSERHDSVISLARDVIWRHATILLTCGERFIAAPPAAPASRMRWSNECSS